MWIPIVIGLLIGAGAGFAAARHDPARRGHSTGRTTIYVLLGALAGGLLGAVVFSGPRDEGLYAVAQWPHLTSPAGFTEAISSPAEPVVVFFYREGCAACEDLAPRMKALARTHAGRADWFAVNATTSPELADAHDVTATPAVVLYRTGRPSRRWTGAEQAAAAETEIPAELSTDLESNRKGRPMPERSDLVTFKGNPLTLVGNELSVGDKAPAFTAVDTDLSPFDLAPMLGEKIIVISSVPSLDTSVCATQTRKFNEEAADIGDDVTIVTISMDLPFAQSRWCGAEGVKNLQVISDHKDAAFGESYGMLIKELRLLARAVHVIDKSGKIVHRQIVGEMTDEPDYNAALEAVRAAK